MVPFFSSTGKHICTKHCASTMGLRTTSLQSKNIVYLEDAIEKSIQPFRDDVKAWSFIFSF